MSLREWCHMVFQIPIPWTLFQRANRPQLIVPATFVFFRQPSARAALFSVARWTGRLNQQNHNHKLQAHLMCCPPYSSPYLLLLCFYFFLCFKMSPCFDLGFFLCYFTFFNFSVLSANCMKVSQTSQRHQIYHFFPTTPTDTHFAPLSLQPPSPRAPS